MIASLSRIGAIVGADFRIRFRRVSTVIVFLLLSAFAYVWIPAPSTGRTLIQINGQRAIYNSGAIGLGTASIGMIFVGLFGYYVISNAIRRDIVTRCGVIAASTPMRSGEYLLGKFLGNLTFLATFLCGFMLSSMAMLVVRGEARFEPIIFIEQYLLLTPAAIVFVSAVAVLFESIPWLSGKFGDVVYFFLWSTVIGLVVANETSHGRINWARCFDFTGFGFMIDQLQQTLHTESVSIGASPFDPTKPPILFNGLTLTREWVLPRLISVLAPLSLLPIAALFFHRFDPVRTGRVSGKGQPKLDRQNSKSFQTTEPARGCAPDGPEPRRLVCRCDVDRCRAHFYALSVRVRRVCRHHNREFLRAAGRDFAHSVCGARSHRLGCCDAGCACRNDGQRAVNLASARKLHLVEARFHVPAQFPAVRRTPRPDHLARAAGVRRSHLRHYVRCLDSDSARRHNREPEDVHRGIPHILVCGRERSWDESDVGFRRLLRPHHSSDHRYLCGDKRAGDWSCATVLSRTSGANVIESTTSFSDATSERRAKIR